MQWRRKGKSHTLHIVVALKRENDGSERDNTQIGENGYILSQRSQLFRENEVNGIPVPLEINKKRIYFTDKY